MTISLFKDLKRSGWHSSIMTTFSVDPAFYDASVAWRLRTYRCENNLLLADSRMLARALDASPEAFRDAGRKYLIVPSRARGCFHPKLHLRLGKDGARLIVGSANATAAGWGRNKEVVTAFEWARRSEDAAQVALGPLIAKAYAYLSDCLVGIPGEAVDYKLRLLRRDSSWLGDLEPNARAIELPDGSAVDLVSARGDGRDSILARLVELIGSEQVRRLTVISAYWDQALTGLSELQRLLQPDATVIGLNPASNEIPLERPERLNGLKFIDLSDGGNVERFLHAKVIVAETKGWDHILFGSANCSDDALGAAVVGGRNAESCVYRRLPEGVARQLLSIDYRKTIKIDDLKPVERTPIDDDSEVGSFDPGVLEIFGRSLSWWPAGRIEAADAVALIGAQEFAFRQIGNGHEARIEGEIVYPLIVRVRLADGRVSSPCIVQNQNALRQAAPGLMDRRLRSAFDRVLSGEEDIIDLALEAQVLFNADEPEKENSGRGGAGRSRTDTGGGGAMRNPEDFRKSVKAGAKKSASGEISLTDPGLLELLRIVLRGVMDVGDKNASADDDDAISAGEHEDGEEGKGSSAEPVPPKPKSTREFDLAAIAVRRRKLAQAIKAFEKMIEVLEKTSLPVTPRLAAQTNFIISLMLYASTYEHKLENGRTVKLMEMVPREGNRDVFAVKAALLLKRIWVGTTAVVGRLMVDRRFGTLPDDLSAFIVMTRWAVGRAVTAVMELPIRIAFEAHLVSAALQIFEATGEQVEVAGDFEAALMRKLDASLGFTEADTARLVDQCRTLVDKLRARNQSATVKVGASAAK